MYLPYYQLVELCRVKAKVYCAVWLGCYNTQARQVLLVVLLFVVVVVLPTLFKNSCRVYDIHLGGSFCSFAPSLICNANVPLKHPIPVNISLYLLCHSCVMLVLTTMSSSFSGPTIKYPISYVILLLGHGLIVGVSFYFCLLIYLSTMLFNICCTAIDAQQWQPLTAWHP